MGADAPLVSRLQHVADILQAQTLRFTVSVSFLLSFLHISHFPAFLPRVTLLVVKLHSLRISIRPKSGKLVQSSSIVSIRNACSWGLVGQRGPDPHMDLQSPFLMISPAFVITKRHLI